MKRNLLVTLLLTIMCIYSVQAQNFVVSTPQHKNIVLEEYTGIHCGYCPDGHLRAEQLATDFPDRIVLVNVHAGSFATPAAGEPDFRTIYGEALATEMGVSGYPSGTVNRHIFPELESVPALSRSAWYYAALQKMPELSPINVGFESMFDTATNELTVNVEMYFTGAVTGDCFLQVALLENHVFGYQSDYTNGTQQNYDHKHILRDLLTGQWGMQITPGAVGTYVTQTITSTVDPSFDINNCDLAVYVSESHFEVYTGVMSTAVDGFHDGSTSLYIGTVQEPVSAALLGADGQGSDFSFEFGSAIAGDEDFDITLSSDNAPADWAGTFEIGGASYASQTTYTINNATAEDLLINVVPGPTPAFAKYVLEIKSVTYPTADSRIVEVYVMSGVTDLIVTGSGNWGDGNSYNFEQDFHDGLSHANNTAFAQVGADLLKVSNDEGILSVVNNIYLNIGWKFPSLQETEATVLKSYLDNGGNVFISGQDIAWDIMSGDGYGGPEAQSFFTNYLNAGYANDGSSANSQFNAVSTDPIFGDIANTTLSDIFGGNMYPDQLTPLNGAEAIFTYNTAAKIGGLRYTDGNYKVVYIGVDIAMIDDAAVRKEILKRSHDWFYNLLDSKETTLDNSISIFPNPSNGIVNVQIENTSGNFTVEVMDITGKLMQTVNTNASRTIDISSYQAGIYFVRVSTDTASQTKRIELIK